MALFSRENPPTKSHVPAELPSLPEFTYFGPNITIDGAVTGATAVLIEGTVRGKINLNADLRVGTKARIEATVHAKNVTVEGKLTGDISADEKVELVASATVDGNIKAPKIVVAEGARFRGSVDMGSPRPKESVGEPAAKSK